VHSHENNVPGRNSKGKITVTAVSKCLGGRVPSCEKPTAQALCVTKVRVLCNDISSTGI